MFQLGKMCRTNVYLSVGAAAAAAAAATAHRQVGIHVYTWQTRLSVH